MYYYPSACANMNAAACLDMHYETNTSKYFLNNQYPSQDGQDSKFFINDNVSVNNARSLNGQQLKQLKNHQMLNTNYGKRSCDDDDMVQFKRSRTGNRLNIDNTGEFSSDDNDLSMQDGNGNVNSSINDSSNNNSGSVRYNYNYNNSCKKESEDWPVFQHPDGGIIQFTPNGNIRTFFDEQKGMEVSVLENETTFMNFGAAR